MNLLDNIYRGDLPKDLITKLNFKELYKLRPEDRSKVIVFDREKKQYNEKTIFRAYMSYLKTPEFDSSVDKSYMFLNKEENLPEILKPVVDFAKSLDYRYNQMVVNWYDENDYIEMHRDCNAKMIAIDAPILSIVLEEDFDPYRLLILRSLDGKQQNCIHIPSNSYYILLDNNNVRHGVSKGTGKRISITFRMMDESLL